MSFAASAFAIHAEIPSETSAVVAKGTTQITLDGQIRVRGWWKDNLSADGMPTDTNSQAYYDQRVRLGVDAKITSNVEGYVQLETGSGATDIYTWGNFNSKPASMSILQSWIMYTGDGLFGVPAGLKVGHMPLALGEKEFFDHTKYGDDAIVFFVNPVKEMHVALLTIKFAEGNKAVSGDDLDGYVGLATYQLDPKNMVGINYTYLNQSMNRFSHQNLGLQANGNVSGLGYKAVADIQFGKASETSKYKGYAFMAALNYMVDPVNLRAMFGYGSGQNDSNDVKMFTPYLSNDRYNTLVYDYQMNGASGFEHMGLANTTLFNIGADFTPVKDITAALDGYIIRASKSNTAIAGSDSKDAGWEVDGQIKYNVAKNLTYEVNAGYLKAGKLYGPEKKGVSVVNNVLTLSF